MGSSLTNRLSELDSSSVAEAGGKGSSLGELMRAGAPVPPGFVVTSAAFKAFMEAADHERHVDGIVSRLDSGEIPVAEAVAGIASLLADAKVPDRVAAEISKAAAQLDAPRVSVRSSATCEDGGETAWAGQLDTYLDVLPEDVLMRVRDCWLSIFSEPALAYGAAHGYGGGQFAVAVVVQKMVSSEVSGIGFSVHPVTQEPNLLLIEACLGLGEAIVSGRIVPDQYVVERDTNNIAERLVGDQKEGLFMEPGDSGATWRPLGDSGSASKLTDEQVTEYARLLSKIQDHYGHPVDTEWALENGQFQVLQARPITTLAEEYQQQVIDPNDEWATFIHRPMSLIEVSVQSHWLDSDHADADLGFFSDRAMSIQDDADLAHLFVFPPEFEAALGQIADLYRNERGKLTEILERGHTIYRDCQSRIDAGTKAFDSLDEAGDFFADVAQHTTVIPAWVLLTYEREGFDDPDVSSLGRRTSVANALSCHRAADHRSNCRKRGGRAGILRAGESAAGRDLERTAARGVESRRVGVATRGGSGRPPLCVPVYRRARPGALRVPERISIDAPGKATTDCSAGKPQRACGAGCLAGGSPRPGTSDSQSGMPWASRSRKAKFLSRSSRARH